MVIRHKLDMGKYLQTSFSGKKTYDAGMAFVLILLLTGLISGNDLYYKLAIPFVLVNMIFPRFYYPFALVWYGLSRYLGIIMSKLILTFIFVVFVMPVGFIRALLGKDPMKLREFKRGTRSVFLVRNKKFTAKDIENPY